MTGFLLFNQGSNLD